jgi:homeobox-leucine zipper protein
MEIEQMLPVNVLYRNLVLSGATFGAHRWVATLQRACDRFASLAALGVPHHDPSGGKSTRTFRFDCIYRSNNPCTILKLGMCIAIADDAFLAVTAEGKRGMVKLSQRMVGCFCASLTASATQRWTTLSGTTDVSVRVSSHYSADLGQHSGVVLGAAASIWLPVPCEHVFAFVRDESTRSQVHVHFSRRWPSSFIYFF